MDVGERGQRPGMSEGDRKDDRWPQPPGLQRNGLGERDRRTGAEVSGTIRAHGRSVEVGLGRHGRRRIADALPRGARLARRLPSAGARLDVVSHGEHRGRPRAPKMSGPLGADPPRAVATIA
jgi:hypothetical protein